MKKLSYTPKSLDDLQNIKTNIAVKHGKEIAEKIIGNLTASIRQLEIFPKKGQKLEDMIQYPTNYRYFVVKKNYVIYRIDNEDIKVIRILNEKQDFMQILFKISSVSDENEKYWNKND